MSDFSQASSDGELPDDFVEWQWGVTYTLRPPDGPPLSPGREYPITVSVRRVSAGRSQTYAPLYRHALRIASARGDELAAAAGHPRLHRRIISHGWRSVEIGDKRLATAFVMMGLVVTGDGEPASEGEPVPGDRDLETEGGATLEMLQRQAPQRAPEVYVEFDHRDEESPHPHGIMTLSYGERVEPSEPFSFAPSVARAEQRARFHRRLLVEGLPADAPLEVVRREWFMVHETNLATVHVYFVV
jgi:hypothetical protein